MVDESQRWAEFGRWLVEQRERLGLRRREAARRAKISEASWRDLETGRKNSIGPIKLLPNLSAEVVSRLAEALEVSPEEVLKHVGRTPTRITRLVNEDRDSLSLSGKIARLTARDRRIVEGIVNAMLGED